MARHYFIILVFLLSCHLGHVQNLTIQFKSENTKRQNTIDSLGFQTLYKDFRSLRQGVDSLIVSLQKIGFIDSKLNALEKKTDSSFIANLYLGDQIKSIKVKINDPFKKEVLRSLNLKKTDSSISTSFLNIENWLKTLNQKLADDGDPFSQVQLKNVLRENANTLSADLEIITTKKRTIDNIKIKGYEKFPRSYIKHYAKLRVQQIFNLTSIKKKSEAINQLSFAKQIKDPEVLFSNDSTILYIYVEKTKSNNFDGFLGFGTNEETNKLQFDGYLDLRLVNNLNYGETLKLFYKSDEIDQQTIDIYANLPFIFKSPLEIDLGLTIFRKDTTFSTTTQFANLNYLINPRNKIGIGISSINSSNLLSTSFSNLEDYKSQFYNINFQHIKPQGFDNLFPLNFIFQTKLGTGNRAQDSEKTNQILFEIESFKIFNLNEKNSIYVRLKSASLLSDTFLENELFRFGGINSIRGFEENSLVGNLYGVINSEYRYRLSNSIYVHSVIDAAYIENEIMDSKTKLFGFGFGFGLLTQAGLFRLNYSSGKTEGQQFRLSDSKVHISLSARF